MAGNVYYRYAKLTCIYLFVVAFVYLYTNGNFDRTWIMSPFSEKKDKWIIVTSISPPTEKVKALSQIRGWQLLVVGDKKSPTGWNLSGVIFLSEEEQESLGYEVLKLLPWNSYTRKMVGYLYAIQHRAEFIYDTDDDNATEDLDNFENSFRFGDSIRGLVLHKSDGHCVANPYTHFGQPTIWPRGYPLDKIGEVYNHTYTACRMRTPPIQQGVVNGDPDVDAIFRLTRKSVQKSLNIQFDPSAPAVIFPKGLLSPFNSQNTLFHYSAFWSLLLPVSVAFRVTDIWRGYWAQPLLWKMGANLAFFPPKTTQLRNAHLYLRDFGNEDQLYKQASDLTAFLSKWDCASADGNSVSFFDCMIQLSQEMAEKGFWSTEDVNLVKAWVRDLKRVGYLEPSIAGDGTGVPCLSGYSNNLAVFHGVTYQSEGNVRTPQLQDTERIGLRRFCNFTLFDDKSSKNMDNRTHRSPIIYFPNTLLVVIFNYQRWFENIWLLDLIYRPHFPNILYCGELTTSDTITNLTKTDNFRNSGVKHFSVINANVIKGYFGYDCALKAIEMGYFGLEGYLVLSDDMLLNFWNNGKFDKREAWIMKDLNLNTTVTTHSTNEPKMKGWTWWSTDLGVEALKRSLSEIYNQTENKWLDAFRKDRERYGYNLTTGMFAPSDVHYFPASKAEIYYQVGKIFRKNRVFLEIAIPVIVTGLSSPDKLVSLPGRALWRRDRSRSIPFQFYNDSISVLHPLKLNEIKTSAKLREKYCNNYVKKILECV